MGRRPGRRMATGLWGSGLVLLATLAGCVGSDGDPMSVKLPSELDTNIGTVLAGLVMDDEFSPVVGAQVQVNDRPLVVTGEDGTFAVGGLGPGTHTVRIEAMGFDTLSREIELVDGENPPVEFVLRTIGTPVPWTEVVILRGYSICEISLFVQLTAIDALIGTCPLGEPARFVTVNVSDDWKYGVVEMLWYGLESFALYTSKDNNCVTSEPCWGAVMGRSPQRIEAAPGDPEIAERYAPYGPPLYDGAPTLYPNGTFDLYVNTLYAGALQTEINQTFNDVCDEEAGINFGCPGVGISAAGIPFTVFTSIFHVERPREPEKYSALESGT